MRQLTVLPAALSAAILGGLLCLGLLGFGLQVSTAMLQVKALERSVVVKGLAEKEVTADVVIWPIRFSEVGNDLLGLYDAIEKKTELVQAFLADNGFEYSEISVGPPAIVDKQAQNYGNDRIEGFRYTANVIITLYSSNIDRVRSTMRKTLSLGKQGIVIGGQQYGDQTRFLFSGLNTIKPGMIAEATRNAREVALQFARDSESTLGKIKVARQGQFSIADRDSNTPHIKKVRVVSTIEYYLSD